MSRSSQAPGDLSVLEAGGGGGGGYQHSEGQ